MSVDPDTVRRVAKLARIAVDEDALAPMARELSSILDWIEELDAVDVANVAPMTGVTPMALPRRADEIAGDGIRDQILANAPQVQQGFFAVPKVVE